MSKSNSLRSFWCFLIKLIFRNKQVDYPISKQIRKILIYRADAIGDYILTTPIINIIKAHLPNAEIHFLLSPRNTLLASQNHNISKYFIYDGKFRSFLKLIPKMRKENYDIVFTFMIYKTSKVGTMFNILTGTNTIKVAIAHKERQKEYSAYFNILLPVERNSRSLVELLAKIVCDVLGIDLSKQNIRFDLPVENGSRIFADEFVKSNKLKDFIVFNISAGRDYNQWSCEKNEEFLKEVVRKYPELNIVIIASISEKGIAEKLLESVDGNIFIYPPEADLCKIVELIEKSTYVISPDTAILHIAAAKSKPVLAIYSSRTSFLKEWEPYGVPSEIIISENQQPIETIAIEKAVEGLGRLFVKSKDHDNKIILK